MNLNEFPSSPSEGDTVQVNGIYYTYTSGVWDVVSRVKTNFRAIIERLCKESGLNMVSGSFDEGATVTNPADVIWDEFSGKYYSWSGAFPKVVPAGSKPATSGGVGAGAWVDRTQDMLRSELLEVGENLGGELVSFKQNTSTSTIRSFQSKMSDYVSTFDFMTDEEISDVKSGTLLLDVTTSVQNAISFSQTFNKQLLFNSGKYKITGRLTPDPTKPFYGFGEGCGAFDGVSPNEVGTVLCALTPGQVVFNAATDGKVKHRLSNLMIVNRSGGTSETAISASSAIFYTFEDITISGFQYGIKGQRTLYVNLNRLLIRNCTYGVSLWNITATPPLTLNSNYYNNIASIRDCQVVSCGTAYQLAGSGISIDNCDASGFSVCGFQIGGSDFNVTTFNADHLYLESTTGTPVIFTNAIGDIGEIIFAKETAIGISAVSSRVSISKVYAYALVGTLISNNSSTVRLADYSGAVVNPYSNSGGGKTIIQRLMDRVESTTTISLPFGSSTTVASAIRGVGLYELTVRYSDNGTQKTQKYVIRASTVKRVLMEDAVSPYLSVTSVLNGGTGLYDVTFANTATSAYGMEISLYAIIPLNTVI